jgi:hypothetical protein
MRQNRRILAAALVIVVILGFGLWPRGGESVGSGAVNALKRIFTGENARVSSPSNPPNRDEVFSSPFVFYGKVIDENGSPIGGAIALASVHDDFEHATDYSTTSGNDGLFAIKCAKGSNFSVTVSHPSYHVVSNWKGHPNSAQHFDRDPMTITPYSSKQGNPVVFSLKKRGNLEPLKTIGKNSGLLENETRVRLSLNGSTGIPFYIDRVESKRGILVKCWAPDGTKRNSKYIFSWRCEISAPDGMLVETPNNSEYTAPESGYSEIIPIDNPDSMPAEKWRDSVDKTLFVRYSDGVHARINVSIATGGPYVRISGYLNPKPNSRSLEVPNSQ